MAFDPDEYLKNKSVPTATAPISDTTSEFNPDTYLEDIEGPSHSKFSSAVHGAIEGLPFVGSWFDELEAGVRSLGPGSYAEALDKVRERYRAARESNPVTYTGASVAAGLPIDVVKMIPILGQAAGAVEGATYGAGLAEDTSDIAKQAAIGGAIGAVAPVALRSAGRGAKKAFQSGTRKLGKIGANIPEEVTEEYLSRQGQINARPREDIYSDLQNIYTKEASALDDLNLNQEYARQNYRQSSQEVGAARSKAADDLASERFAAESQLQQATQDANLARVRAAEDMAAERFGAQTQLQKAKDDLSLANDAYRRTTQDISDNLKASTAQELRPRIQDGLAKLKDQVIRDSSTAYDLLEATPGVVRVSGLNDILTRELGDLQINGVAISDSAKNAIGSIQSLADRIKQLGDEIAFPDAKRIIQQLDNDINYSQGVTDFSPDAEKIKKAIRYHLNETLKNAVPEYKTQMEMVASKARLLNELGDTFGKDERAISRLNQLATEKGKIDRDRLIRLGEAIGEDYTPEIDNFVNAKKLLANRRGLEGVYESTPEFSNVRAAQEGVSAAEQGLAPFQDPTARSARMGERIGELVPDPNAVSQARQQVSQFRDPTQRDAMLSQKIDEILAATSEYDANSPLVLSDMLNELQAMIKDQRSVVQNYSRLSPDRVQGTVDAYGRGKHGAREFISELDDTLGTSYGSQIHDRNIMNNFEKGHQTGSRNAVVLGSAGAASGALMGGPLGSAVGSAIGAGTGAVVDKYAGPIFKRILDGQIAVGQIPQQFYNSLGPKYGPMLQNASKRGRAGLVSTHYILQQQDPEYQKMVEGMTLDDNTEDGDF